jgi:hypothetical protein
VALAALVSSSVALAQTCPACYQNAAAQTPGLLQALRTGILVMMLPSLSMFIVIFAVVFRRRDSFNVDTDTPTELPQDLGKVAAAHVAGAGSKI